MTEESTSGTTVDSSAIRRMTAFAVMTVDWSSQRRSYLDNFLNYALAVIPSDSTKAFPREAVRPSIIERFNLTLPGNIVQQLLRRGIRLGFLTAVGDAAVTLTEKGKREVSPIPYTLKKLAAEQVAVAERFVGWAVDEIGLVIESAQANAMLLDYVETYYCSLMSLARSDPSTQLSLPLIEPSPEQRVTAAFVAAMNQTDEALFDSIANMARGSMMVSALYAPSLVDTTRGFSNTTIYLDTKIVLRALGYEGEQAQQATTDLLMILKKQKARLAVFEFTLREIQSVLDAVAAKARGGRMWDSRPGSVEAYFYRTNASNAQIEQHSIRVESQIRALSVNIDPSPSYENHRFVIDEGEIERTLLAGNPNYRSTALKHDVELIAAIVRARRGRARQSLEESRATFMTLNSLVVNTARFAQRDYKEAWPLVMFENDIAALVWVKEPLAVPNLPRNQLLATSLGLTNPGKHDWNLYIAEFGRLLESGSITDDDVILLRQKYERDSLAFVGSTSGANDTDKKREIRTSIEAAREAVRQELTAPIQAEKDQLASELADAHNIANAVQSRADLSRVESDRLLRAHLKRVWMQGAAINWSVRAGLLLVAVAAIAVTFIPDLELWLESLPGGDWVLWGVRLIAVVAAVTGGLWGPIAHLGTVGRERFILRNLKNLEIEPGRAEELGYAILE